MNGFTIIIPMYRQPNHLATCLRGLIRNSHLQHRILVVWSDPGQFGHAKANDFAVDRESLVRYQKYTNVEDYIKRRGDWAVEHNIEFHNVTEQAKQFQVEYAAGIHHENPWMDGTDTAWKDNVGIHMTESEFVVPNWDADFYPAPGWDEPLLHLANSLFSQKKELIFVPTHVQPVQFDVLPEWKDIYVDCKYIACARLTLPLLRAENSIFDEEFEEFFRKWRQEVFIAERPGLREHLHHFPVLYRTEQLKNTIGPYSYMGAGYDLEIDDRCGRLGFTKITPRNSYLMHKGYIATAPAEI